MAIVLAEHVTGARVFCGLAVRDEQCEQVVQVRVTLLDDGLVASHTTCKWHAGQIMLESADWVATGGTLPTPWFG